jgi:nucleoside-diphosphate-sugar epimerase
MAHQTFRVLLPNLLSRRLGDHRCLLGCKSIAEVIKNTQRSYLRPCRLQNKTTFSRDNLSGDNAKVIVVFGSTGQQGGSVVRAMKDDKNFVLKAATRNTDSDKAKQLTDEGVQVIQVDISDPASCKEALKGAYGVFLVTNFFDTLIPEREIQQGKNVVNAAKENGIQHLVFSGLRSPKETAGLEGCHHFETKKAIYDYIVRQGIPYTVVDYAMYYENLTGAMKPRKNENNEYVLDIPMLSAPLDMLCVSDAGEVTHQIFVHQDEYKGRWIPLASQSSTIEEYANILTKLFPGKKFVAGKATPEQFAKYGFPGAEDLAVMFKFYISGKCDHDIELTRKLHPGILTFEQWVEKNRDVFEAAFP